jgi:hypothetical protein
MQRLSSNYEKRAIQAILQIEYGETFRARDLAWLPQKPAQRERQLRRNFSRPSRATSSSLRLCPNQTTVQVSPDWSDMPSQASLGKTLLFWFSILILGAMLQRLFTSYQSLLDRRFRSVHRNRLHFLSWNLHGHQQRLHPHSRRLGVKPTAA